MEAFKYDLKTGTGCKSGAKIGKMETQYSYNFINYGHQNGFIDYLANEYSIAPDTLKGIVYDRNFLYGNYKDGDPDNKIEGIVNLYREVVVPFVNNFMSLLLEFHNFSHQWLSCPKYNKNYHRGPFTVGEGISKYLYKNQSVVNLANEFPDSNINGNILPEGTIVKFHPEKDNNAFAMDGTTNFYKVSSVTIPGQLEKSYTINEKVCIKLSYEDKKNCNDKDIDCILFNLGNYTSTEGLTDQRDIDAVSGYNNFGIPYFINNGNMSKIDNSKGAKLSKTVLFNWKEDEKFGTNEIKNWYSYEKKPNTEQFGIDCSGLVLNCLLEISKKNENSTIKFESTVGLDINASVLGSTHCRLIEKNKESKDKQSHIGKGDIVYISHHIGVCNEGNMTSDFDTEYTLCSSINNRFYNTIHNYGYISEDSEKVTKVFTMNDGGFKNLFSSKTLCGPVKHWGVMNVNFGRLYLWTK